MSDEAGRLLHRLWNTPMRDLLRGRVSARLNWCGVIADADLPEPAARLVTQLVRKTRLWRSEKADVAEELIAHFHDGVAAGKSIDNLIADFGRPDVAARLIRRAKKRNRSWAWHALKYSGMTLVGMVVLYASVGLWFATAKPVISVDYLAKLNEPVAAIPEVDRAWPLYRDLLRIWQQTRIGLGHSASPGDDAWPKIEAFIHNHPGLLEKVRQAAAKPALGRPLGFQLSDEDYAAVRGPDAPEQMPPVQPGEGPLGRVLDGSLLGILLPHLGPLKGIAGWLRVDIALAAQAGDAQRIIDDIAALHGLAKHARSPATFLICQLVGISIADVTLESLARVIDLQPALFDDAQLADLAHSLEAMHPLGELNVLDEQSCVLDSIQRIYSDDGHGDGRLTLVGLAALEYLRIQRYFDSDQPELFTNDATLAASFPAVAFVAASRSEMTDTLRHYFALAQSGIERPLWEILREDDPAQQYMNHLRAEPLGAVRYAPLTALIGWGGTVGRGGRIFQARIDTLQVAIALELYRREYGDYPSDLAALAPRYYPTMPVDHSTGEPLCYRLIDGKPLLYGRGFDGDDDGGRRPEEGKSALKEGVDADWVLYPPAE